MNKYYYFYHNIVKVLIIIIIVTSDREGKEKKSFDNIRLTGKFNSRTFFLYSRFLFWCHWKYHQSPWSTFKYITLIISSFFCSFCIQVPNTFMITKNNIHWWWRFDNSTFFAISTSYMVETFLRVVRL